MVMDDSLLNQLEKVKILNRLRKIEGQVRGIQGMIIEERSCAEIMAQMAAVKSALNQVSKLLVEDHLNSCFSPSLSSEDISPHVITEIIDLMLKFLG